MQEGEWDRGRGKVEEGEKRKGDEGDIGRGREKRDEGAAVPCRRESGIEGEGRWRRERREREMRGI